MGKICVLCDNKQNPDSPVTFHKFPLNAEIQQVWKDICNFNERDDVSKIFICSRHFKADDYLIGNSSVREYYGYSKLKRGTYPSVNVPNMDKVPVSRFPRLIFPDPVHHDQPTQTIIITPITNTSQFKIEVDHSNSRNASEMPQNMYILSDSPMPQFDTEPEKSLLIQIEHSVEELSDCSEDPLADSKVFGHSECQISGNNLVQNNADSDTETLPSDIKDGSNDVQTSRKVYLPRYVGEIMVEDFANPNLAKRSLQIVKEGFHRQRKKIRLLQMQIKQQTDKIAELKTSIAYFEKDTPNSRRKSLAKIKKNPKNSGAVDINPRSYFIKAGRNTCAVEGCGKEFKYRHLFENHIKQQHKEIYLYLCSICGSGLHSKQKLLIHEKKHAGVKQHPCEVCDKRFFNWRSLQVHQRTVHLHVRHSCSQCAKWFTSPHSLKRHELAHAGKKAFKCSKCPKSFYAQSELNYHFKCRHLGHKRYKCDICYKSFYRNNALKVHSKIHSEDWPFQCPETGCGRKFRANAQLKIHRNTHDT